MKRLTVLLTTLTVLNACVSDHDLIQVNPAYFFHNNTSKVWMVIHKYKSGKDFSPLSMRYKDVIIFHKTGNLYLQKLNTLGDEIGQKGTLNFTKDFKQVSFEFEKESWLFDLKMLSTEKIILKPKRNYQFTLELIPIPEPN